MLRSLSLLLCLALGLSACARLADSRINPLNWFGRSTEVAVAPAGPVRPLVTPGRGVTVVDARVRIETVTDVSIERTPGGAILRATGLAATQGYFNAQLVLVEAADGVAVYEFRVEAPPGFEAIGSEASRRITVAETLDAATLAALRTIEVRGAQNARRTSR